MSALKFMTDLEWQGRMTTLLQNYDIYKQIEQFEDLVTEKKKISTWADFQKWSSLFGNRGCFRGQREAKWQLVATLDRKLRRTIEVKTPKTHSSATHPVNQVENERDLLLQFQRGAHHYNEDVPPWADTVDWLAMMQHHGAPTRLLDWTRSVYVALFFALRDDSPHDSVLWAIDLEWLKKRSDELLGEYYDDFPIDPTFDTKYDFVNRKLMTNPEKPLIIPVAPRRLNERMTVQQGELLYNLNWVAFSVTLLSMLIHPTKVTQQKVSRVLIKRDHRISMLEELRRMNIHEASLFPGLDGFAKSLNVNLEISLVEQVEKIKAETLEYQQNYEKAASEN